MHPPDVPPGDIEEASSSVIGLAWDYEAGTQLPPHRHLRHQLLYASVGVMRIVVPKGIWVVPPLRAVWLPGGTVHEVRAVGALSMRTLYFHPESCREMPSDVVVCEVSPLLRELVLRAVERRVLRNIEQSDSFLIGLIREEIREAPSVPLLLPRPSDPRLRRVTEALETDLADDRPLAAWARAVGASARTLARLFIKETGLSFAEWRRQARLVASLERLAEGVPIKSVAAGVGYTPSAFVTMFQRALGTTPGRYFRSGDGRDDP